MDSEFCLWLCYVKLLVSDSDKNSGQLGLVYYSMPAKNYSDLVGFQDEKLKIIAIFNFHPMNRCAIAEIHAPEQINASTKVLMVQDNLLNFRLWAKRLMRKSNWVAYYGFDVETVMQVAANKHVDIIIVNSGYSGKYREVNWMGNIRMLKSNPETAQIPVILKFSAQALVGDREKYLVESGADDVIFIHPGSWNSLEEKIKHTLSANKPSQNTTIILENKVSGSQTVKIQEEKESVLDLALLIYGMKD